MKAAFKLYYLCLLNQCFFLNDNNILGRLGISVYKVLHVILKQMISESTFMEYRNR